MTKRKKPNAVMGAAKRAESKGRPEIAALLVIKAALEGEPSAKRQIGIALATWVGP
jgi:hypothetical protein